MNGKKQSNPPPPAGAKPAPPPNPPRPRHESKPMIDLERAWPLRVPGSEIDRLIDERDQAEDAMNEAYLLVVGHAPQWNNAFGYGDALEEMRDALVRAKTQTIEDCARICDEDYAKAPWREANELADSIRALSRNDAAQHAKK